MGWLVARTDMPLRRTVRALVTASFVTPPFLGAIAWELLAAPNTGLINKTWRALTGMPADEYLFNIYSLGGPDLRHLLLHVPLRVRADRQCARPHSRRSRGRFLDPRRPHLDHRPAGHDPARLARPAGRRAGRLPAGDDAVRLAGDPCDPGRLPHHDDEDLEPVQLSAEARARGRRLDPAAGVDDRAAARRAPHPRPARLFGGRRQAGRSAIGQARLVQMGRARARVRSC